MPSWLSRLRRTLRGGGGGDAKRRARRRGARCGTCGAPQHDFARGEGRCCVPPPDARVFDGLELDASYRRALHAHVPQLTAEELVSTALGHGWRHFPSQEMWLLEREELGGGVAHPLDTSSSSSSPPPGACDSTTEIVYVPTEECGPSR